MQWLVLFVPKEKKRNQYNEDFQLLRTHIVNMKGKEAKNKNKNKNERSRSSQHLVMIHA